MQQFYVIARRRTAACWVKGAVAYQDDSIPRHGQVAGISHRKCDKHS